MEEDHAMRVISQLCMQDQMQAMKVFYDAMNDKALQKLSKRPPLNRGEKNLTLSQSNEEQLQSAQKIIEQSKRLVILMNYGISSEPPTMKDFSNDP